MRGLTNKRTVITEGASGIGKATVMCFLEEGAQVVVIDREAEAIEQIEQLETGVIANMGSTNGLLGYPYYADYNTTKACVIDGGETAGGLASR